MDFSNPQFWLDLVQVVVMSCVAVYLWWDRRTKANKKSITSLNNKTNRLSSEISNLPDTDDMNSLKIRITSLENIVSNLPTKEDMHKNELRLTEMQGDLETAIEKIEGQNRTMNGMGSQVDRIHDYLMNSKGKSE